MPDPALTPEEVGAALGESAPLDEPLPDPYADEDGEFMAAAMTAVGGEAKATALKDAITACLRSHGLIGGGELEAEGDEEIESDVGAGFEDL